MLLIQKVPVQNALLRLSVAKVFFHATNMIGTVWECVGWQRHLIIQQIIEHVICRHLLLDVSRIHVAAGQLDFSLLEEGTGDSNSHLSLLCFEVSQCPYHARCTLWRLTVRSLQL